MELFYVRATDARVFTGAHLKFVFQDWNLISCKEKYSFGTQVRNLIVFLIKDYIDELCYMNSHKNVTNDHKNLMSIKIQYMLRIGIFNDLFHKIGCPIQIICLVFGLVDDFSMLHQFWRQINRKLQRYVLIDKHRVSRQITTCIKNGDYF